MSMNLHVEDDTGYEIDLWQTPTWVTDMCLFSWKINKEGYRQQRKWEDTLIIYLDWVRSHSQGRWDSVEESQDMQDRISSHVKELNEAGVLKFYSM